MSFKYFSYAYDGFSRLRETTQPNGVRIYSDYDSTGALKKVSVPGSDFRDFDFDQLKQEREAVMLELIRLEGLVKSKESRIQYHVNKVIEYEAHIAHFQSLYAVVNAGVGQLEQLRNQHLQQADRYRTQIRYMRAAAARFNQFKNLEFTYVGEVGGKFVFEFTRCISTHGWGPLKRCDKYKTDTTEFEIGALDPGIPGSHAPISFFRDLGSMQVCKVFRSGSKLSARGGNGRNIDYGGHFDEWLTASHCEKSDSKLQAFCAQGQITCLGTVKVNPGRSGRTHCTAFDERRCVEIHRGKPGCYGEFPYFQKTGRGRSVEVVKKCTKRPCR